MLNIKKVEIQGFWLLDDVEIDFNGKKGLISSQGINNDFFDSNSSGKSTLPNAICQILYNKNIEGKPQAEIYNKYTGRKFRGYIELEVQNQKVEILRDYHKKDFDFWVDGVKDTMASKPKKQELLENILGLSFETFSKLFYLSPNRISLFSTNEEAVQGRFIKELLSLDFVTDINKRADQSLKLLKNEIDNVVKDNERDLKQIEYINDQIKLIRTQSFDTTELLSKKEKLEEVQYEKEKAEKELKEFEVVLKQAKEEHDKYIAKGRYLKEIQKDKDALISQERCPTCKQKMNNINDIKGELKDLEKEIDENREIAYKINQENIVKSQTHISLKRSVEKLNKEEIILEKDIERLEILKKEGEDNDKVKFRNKLRKDLQELNQKVVQARATLSEFEDKVYVYELIKGATSAKGFVKERITLFIELFNNTLNKISKPVLGGESGVWVERSSKDTFEVIVQDTDTKHYYRDLSSGFKRRIDVLLCLALNLSIKALTGIDINMLFLDEVFSNVDENGRKDLERMLISITTKFPDKMLITVLHGDNIQSDYTLITTRENNQSTISWSE